MRKAVSSAVTYARVKAPFWIGAMVSCKLSGYFNLQATAGEYVVSTQKLLFPTHAKVRRLYLLWEWRAAITHQHPLHHQVKIHFTSSLFLASHYPQMGSLPRDNLFLRRVILSSWPEEKAVNSLPEGERKGQGFPMKFYFGPFFHFASPCPNPLKIWDLKASPGHLDCGSLISLSIQFFLFYTFSFISCLKTSVCCFTACLQLHYYIFCHWDQKGKQSWLILFKLSPGTKDASINMKN